MKKYLVLAALALVCSVAYASWSPTMSGTGPVISEKGVTYSQMLSWDPGAGTKTLTEIQYEWHAFGGLCPDSFIPPNWSECHLPSGLTMKLCFKTLWNCVNVPTAEGWYQNTAFAGQTFTSSNARIYLKWHVAGTGSMSPVIQGETNYASARYTP